MLSDNLKNFINTISIHSAYYGFENVDVFIVNARYKSVFVFNENQIYLYDNETKLISNVDFIACIKEAIEFEKEKINSINLSIEKREELILQGKRVKNFSTKYFRLKIKLNKCYKNINSLLEACKICFNEQHCVKKNLKTTIINLSNLEKNIKENLSRLEGIYMHINSIRSEKINKNIYFLSVISAIFLPLNLIVGFFGMNTKNLFFSENENATFYIFVVILFVFVVLFLWYWMQDKKELDLDEFSSSKKT